MAITMKAANFKLDDENDEWRAKLPRKLRTFFGKTITVTMDRLMPGQLKQPGKQDRQLLARILRDLPRILARAVTEFEQYELASDPSFAGRVANPQIWISCSEEGREDEWTFVVERSDHPDYGCHIEFKGTEFKEIWGGD
ncbi:MAG TPA: hypothetical protein VFZ59_05500 [Verrucomicrobiae bacterium]|nr:hypothetical protein [Verrucomicrobiae bacterium]